MENYLFGLAGLALIIIAWAPGVIGTIKSGKPGMEKRFMALYFLGSASLAYYAWLLNDLPFLTLNALAALVPLIHMYFYLRVHGFGKILT